MTFLNFFKEEGGKNCLQTGMENCTLNSNLGGSSFIHNISRRYSSLKLKGGKGTRIYLNFQDGETKKLVLG